MSQDLGGGVGTGRQGAEHVIGNLKETFCAGMTTLRFSKLRNTAGSNTRTGTGTSVSDDMRHGHLSVSQQEQCPGPRARQTGQLQTCTARECEAGQYIGSEAKAQL